MRISHARLSIRLSRRHRAPYFLRVIRAKRRLPFLPQRAAGSSTHGSATYWVIPSRRSQKYSDKTVPFETRRFICSRRSSYLAAALILFASNFNLWISSLHFLDETRSDSSRLRSTISICELYNLAETRFNNCYRIFGVIWISKRFRIIGTLCFEWNTLRNDSRLIHKRA